MKFFLFVFLFVSFHSFGACSQGENIKSEFVSLNSFIEKSKVWYMPFTTYDFWEGKKCAKHIFTKITGQNSGEEIQEWDGVLFNKIKNIFKADEHDLGRTHWSVKLGPVETFKTSTWILKSDPNKHWYIGYYCSDGIVDVEGIDVRSDHYPLSPKSLLEIEAALAEIWDDNVSYPMISKLLNDVFEGDYTDCSTEY